MVTVDGANLWITVWGELWKVAREQCRLATNSEKEGIELVLKECAELIDEYKKTSKRAGYKDLTEEPWPDLEEEDGEEAAEEVVKERGEKRKVRFQEDDDLYEPTTEEETDDRGDLEERRRASRESVQTREEPEGEDEMSRRTESMNSLPEATGPSIELEGPEEASRSVIPAGNPMQDPRYREAVRVSTLRADRLDGVPAKPERNPAGAVRSEREERAGPYLAEILMLEEAEEDHEKELDRSRERLNRLMAETQQRKKSM